MRPALARRLLMMTLLLVSLTLFATTLGAMRLPLASLLPAGDEMLRHIWLTIRLPRVLLALLVATTLIIPAALAVWWMASRLNLLQLGDEEAHYLGVNVRALQRWLLLCSAVLVAAAVAISGVIGFIGLVVPHLMRLWLGPDHRGLIPGSLLAGAILLLLADTLARTVAAPAEMPVGLLTSLLGAPWFLWLVFRRENSRHG
ncbi:FecCD family ABC transporter permease [Klebsiella quasipneumoniae]|uniref:FecCD family ABC transporter permease n=1 Tax=Klebsiella quasipneumoniae TaxID=1463165 RepID=UPI00388F84ED|nr:iron ABC transporter permease [Klebsiella quasipneumoniae]